MSLVSQRLRDLRSLGSQSPFSFTHDVPWVFVPMYFWKSQPTSPLHTCGRVRTSKSTPFRPKVWSGAAYVSKVHDIMNLMYLF